VASRLSPTTRQTGAETKGKIIAAALDTLREEGIVGATARAIARRGEFNQALIFYHFGSVTDLLVAAAVNEGEQRAARYQPRLESVSTLAELVAVARELHDDEVCEGGLNVLTQLVAGSASSPELRAGLMSAFQPWMHLVQDAVARVLAPTPYANLVRTDDLAFAIASLFLGIELMHTLEPDAGHATALFDTFGALATVVEALLQ
jgi:AcrR family transcriptional regulator